MDRVLVPETLFAFSFNRSSLMRFRVVDRALEMRLSLYPFVEIVFSHFLLETNL